MHSTVCTIAVPVVVVAVGGSVVVLADVIADNLGDIAYVVSFVELAGIRHLIKRIQFEYCS